MKPWNKPVRVCHLNEGYRKQFPPYWGVDNWFVGTCNGPLAPWVQFQVGYWSIQVKWYVIIVVLLVLAFFLGRWSA